MAQAGPQLYRENFLCSICLDLLKDPVTIPCGHNYCRECIQDHWDVEEVGRICSCPQCRKTYTQRPVLEINTMLADFVEQVKKTGLRAAPADHCYAGAEDVACDVCTERKLKALKSCLDCRASYCDVHLQSHRDAVPLQKHQLVEPTKELQENICPRHNQVRMVFCRTDQQIICSHCSMHEHKGHYTVLASAERTERQRELEETRQKIQQKIQDTEEDVKVLQKEVEAIDRSADEAVNNSEAIFTQMIRVLEEACSAVEWQVRSTQEAEVSQVKELQKKMEQDITELKRIDAELQKISHTQDHTQFLHNTSSLSAISQSLNLSRLEIRPLSHFEDVTAAVLELKDIIQEDLMETWTNISQPVSNVRVLPLEPEPVTREDFLRYSRELTLDPNTAHRLLLLSEGNRKVTFMVGDQSYCDHPDRFTGSPQVLSRESLSGRCYWEVEWGGSEVGVAVAYKNISGEERSNEYVFGFNDKSWTLRCDKDGYQFYHDNIQTPVSGTKSSRVGVYLDHGAGVLAFYSVSGTMTLLYRVQTTFTQPLHAGVLVYLGSTAELCQVRQTV